MRPPPTLLRIFSHSSEELRLISSVRLLTERLSPRNVPNRPSVTNMLTAAFMNRSARNWPRILRFRSSSISAGVFVLLPKDLYTAAYSSFSSCAKSVYAFGSSVSTFLCTWL